MRKVPEKIKLHELHLETKSWGHETWIVNNESYCGKLLHINRGRHTSMHFHSKKLETMYCLKGEFRIDFMDTKSGLKNIKLLTAGDSITIEPNTPHEIWGISEENILIEFSTHHENEDSYRVGEPG